MNMDDIFSQFGDIFGDDNPFGSFFGGSNRRSSVPGRGDSGAATRVKLKLNFEEIAKGAKRPSRLKNVPLQYLWRQRGERQEQRSNLRHLRWQRAGSPGTEHLPGQMQTVTTCPTCNGEGSTVTHKCTACKGDGRVYGKKP